MESKSVADIDRWVAASPYRYLLLWLGFWVLTLLLYAAGTHAHFIFDFNSWVIQYNRYRWGGIAHNFGDRSMHHLGHLVAFTIYRVVGLNPYIWTAFLTAFHAANSLLLFIFISRIYRLFKLPHGGTVALMSAVMFICSPLHTEILIWGSTVWYQMSLMGLLASLIWFIDYLVSGRSRLVGFIVVVLASYWTWEISFCIPFVLLGIWVFTPANNAYRMGALYRMVIPAFAGILLYLIINHLRTGHWVSHYGEAAHLNTHLHIIVSCGILYLLKLSTIYAILSYHYRDLIVQWLKTPMHSAIVAVAAVMLAGVITYLLRHRPALRISWLFFILSLATLIPVINIGYGFLHNIENDRYIYIASAFFYAAVVSLLLYGLSGHPALFVYGVLIGGLLYYQHQFVSYWQLSGRVQNNLVSGFHWQDAKRIFILATADNVNGAYCLRSQPNSTIAEALLAQRGIDVKESVQEVYQFNMVTATDSITAEWTDSNHIKVTFAQYGNWYWKESFGANPLDKPDFATTIDQWGMSYILTLKHRLPSDVFIYQAKDHWMELR